MNLECPNVMTLTRYISGALDESVADEVSLHLENCQRCEKRVDDLSTEPDSLVQAIRRTHEIKVGDEFQLDEMIQKARRIATENPESREATAEPASLAERLRLTSNLDTFIKGLQKSGLFDADEVEHIVSTVDADDTDSFARQLVERQILTVYQAWALGRGRWKGLILGNYIILEKLGEGGVGKVYRARHRRMGRTVCLKILRTSGRRTPEAVERFRREIKAVSALSHPNFIIAHDADEAEGIQFLVMEFIEGRNLAQLVANEGPPPIQDSVEIVRQVADALDHAHRSGVIHRDIKPQNLLLTASEENPVGLVKVLDLGIARFEPFMGPSSDITTAAMTETGAIVGTVDYMAPEQALNSRNANNRSDIYSLGCTLYYLVTGKKMHAGETLMEKLVAHRELPPPLMRDSVPEVSKGLEAVYLKMVARDPLDRYNNMAEVARDLEAVLAGKRPSAQTAWRPAWLRRAFLLRDRTMLVGPLVAALLVTIGFYLWHIASTDASSTDSTRPAANPIEPHSRSGNADGSIAGPFAVVDEVQTLQPWLVVIPFDRFNQHDYWKTVDWLKKKGMPFQVTSSREGSATPEVKKHAPNKSVYIEMKLTLITSDDYAGVIFCGGKLAELHKDQLLQSKTAGLIDSTLRKQGTVIAVTEAGWLLDTFSFENKCRYETVKSGLRVASLKDYPGGRIVRVPNSSDVPTLVSWLVETSSESSDAKRGSVPTGN